MSAGPPSPPTTSRGPHASRIRLGAIILVLGVLWLLDSLGVEIPGRFVGPGALIVIGVGLVVASRSGQSEAGLIVLGIIITVVLGLGTVGSLPLSAGVGDRTYRPTTVQDVRSPYELTVGSLTVDLSSVPVPLEGANPLQVKARVGVGQIVVVVPRAALVDVTGRSGIGQVVIFGSQRSGVGVEDGLHPYVPAGGSIDFEIDASAGIGQVEVRYG